MTWRYTQSTGEMKLDDELFGIGYSGAGACKNDPSAQELHNEGPIPRGVYTIGPPHDTTTHGPYVMPLLPDEDNEMFGRSAFLIHGDSVRAPGTASQGCIILPRKVREEIWDSGDRELVVSDV